MFKQQARLCLPPANLSEPFLRRRKNKGADTKDKSITVMVFPSGGRTGAGNKPPTPTPSPHSITSASLKCRLFIPSNLVVLQLISPANPAALDPIPSANLNLGASC